ncbi:MAG TPA: glycosyltransferase, partial [Acidimicrobiales bacterium]|nr:glycosyltransferase [Acidimicrobiales bacterium]
MRRPPASIVVLAWNAWDATRACLESLRPTLGVHDQVVVVDNGSTDATAQQLARFPWVEVVTNEENRGFAGGCNDGAAAARHGHLVFLNNDTLLAGRWLDALVAPFDDDSVGAAGPRSNFVSGPQVVPEATYAPGDMGALRRFARAWAEDHRGLVGDTDRLVGFCLAVRRDVFEQVGGFDESYGIGGYEDDDLCRRILETGHRLVIAHESFVHHDGHRTFDANGLDWFAEQESNRDRFAARHLRSAPAGTPLVSGCLITKDEAENITVCLESLTDLCDEIVVYDTGSSDDTVAMARQAGAVVVEGYWDDDFSRARNAALAHCRGEWIAWLDADETLETPDVGGLRSLLARGERSVDGYAVPIDNLTGTGAGATFVHSACRLFRRAACEWVGRLHEQVARREDHRGINQATQDLARIRHTGYLESVMQARDKVERNLRLASAEVEHAAGWEKGFSLTSLGRSYLTAGRLDEAFVHCRDALAHTDNPIIRRLALRSAAEALFAAGRLDEALEWSARLRAESTKPVLADLLEAKIRLARGEFRSALALFDTVGACSVDDDGFEHAAHMYAASRAEALAGLGRPAEAADALLGALFEHGVLDTHLGAVIEFLELGGRPLTELALAIPADKAPIFFAQLLQLQPHAADAVLEACLECHGDPLPVLATAATLSRRLPVERTLAWSARMREAGLSDACPLVALARGDRSPVDRARAAAVAVAAFGDERARPAFALALKDASIAERATIEAETAAICPTLLPAPLPPPQQSDPSSASVSGPASSAPWPSARVAGEMPRVSVVIPCFDRAALTLRCLESLGAHTDPGAYDVILVDNGSTDATVELAGSQSESFRVVRNDHNTGFGPACNQGAALARGQYVLFLNNDTEVLPGWLEPLVAALDEDEDLGAVQPKLLYPDGRLNDAGGLVFAGGAPWVYGKGHPDPADPRFDCRRAPDYASGACLLVRRAAFEEVGGFDDRYAPAYFEDTDLSFALRDRGWSVLYEPASTVVHVEGGTAGTDVGSGLKQYQVRNATRFADKWAAELATRPALDPATVDSWAHRPQGGFGPGERRRVPRGPGAWDDACADAERAKSILVIDPFMPVFDRASGSLRLFTLLRTLREAGHAVTFLPTAGGDRRYARAVGNFGVLCFGAPPETLAAWPEAVVRRYFPLVVDLLAATHFDVVVLSPWKVGELLLRDVRAAAPDALVVLDTNDVHFRRLERELALGAGSLDGRAVADEKARELAVYRQADRIVCVTEDDVAAVRAEIPGIDGVVLPNAHGLVDPGPGFDERGGAVFVGNFNHPPNADAVSWWKSEIAPLLAHRLPGVGLTVVGNDPAGVAATMAGGGVTVTGAVHSTLPHLHAARVSVAPLRYGAGMKGKVGEALAAGLPVVLTSVAAEGMALVDGRHALVADTPEEFAAAVARLHTDPELWTRLRDAGRAHVDAHLGLGRMRDGLETVLAPAGRPARGPNRQARRQARRTGGSVATPAPPTLPAPPAAPAAPAQAGPAPGAGIETPARPVTICLAMNTRNEETRVEHAIASCPGVDEIVVADMESTDGTVERARGAGARVLTLPNAGYCEPGRQPLLDAVESTWALVLDADEQLRPGGIDALRALVQGAPADVSAYRIPRVTMCGPTEVRGSGWGTGVERHPRFVRCRDVTWPSTIHAVPSFTGTVAELPDGSDVEILHQNFDDLEHALEKFNRYSGIEAAERLAAGERPTWRDALADAVDECTARYQPEVDGGLSLALAFGLFSYRLGVHLKTLESAGELRDAPVPRAE